MDVPRAPHADCNSHALAAIRAVRKAANAQTDNRIDARRSIAIVRVSAVLAGLGLALFAASSCAAGIAECADAVAVFLAGCLENMGLSHG